MRKERGRTETKKLLTPSRQLNHFSGKRRSQVSSPAKATLFGAVPPRSGAASCRNHESTFSNAAELDVSSARLRRASTKVGFDPVVRALRRGRVTVGACATAVYGSA